MIQLISKDAYAQTTVAQGIVFPSSIDWNCPFCGRKVNFVMHFPLNNSMYITHCNSTCSGCRKEATFVYLGFNRSQATPMEGELYIFPEPKIRRLLEGIETTDDFSKELFESYKSLINVYNVREWTATAVLCRRLLEGITMHILPEEKKKLPLAKQLQELPNHIDLQKPLLTLADALRKGGNLGAHFDLEKIPNEDIAALMMDLLDYLIEYIYILPDRISELHERIQELSNKPLMK